MDEYRQMILVRHDLKMPKGKTAAQVAHAAVEAAWRADKDAVRHWRDQGMGKIVLRVDTEKELLRRLQIAKDEGLPTALITDAGHTVVAPGTRTCGAVGPAPVGLLDRLFGDLKLL